MNKDGTSKRQREISDNQRERGATASIRGQRDRSLFREKGSGSLFREVNILAGGIYLRSNSQTGELATR